MRITVPNGQRVASRMLYLAFRRACPDTIEPEDRVWVYGSCRGEVLCRELLGVTVNLHFQYGVDWVGEDGSIYRDDAARFVSLAREATRQLGIQGIQ